MSRAFTRRQVLVAAAGAMLGFGACQKQETASDKPELVLRYAENQPEDYPTTQAALLSSMCRLPAFWVLRTTFWTPSWAAPLPLI